MAVAGPSYPPLPKLLRTAFNPFAVEFSPFEEQKFAVASAQYFGIVGNGQLLLCTDDAPGPEVVEYRRFLSNEGLFDVSWNEANEHQLVTAGADGSVKIWDVNAHDNFPIAKFGEHEQEVSCVTWNLVEKGSFVSTSWDQTVKLWRPEVPHAVVTYRDHAHCVYSAAWNPRSASVFVTAGGDRMVNVFDMKMPTAAQSIGPVHADEILTVDWNKYEDNVVVTGGVDGMIFVWDVRRPGVPVAALAGHKMAVRRVKCSPHSPQLIASASYDMSVAVWDVSQATNGTALVQHANHHTEFVCGVDFSLFRPNVIASCAWDRAVALWDLSVGPPAPIPSLGPSSVGPAAAGDARGGAGAKPGIGSGGAAGMG